MVNTRSWYLSSGESLFAGVETAQSVKSLEEEATVGKED